MDRFIVIVNMLLIWSVCDLKSNMDRFIDLQQQDQATNLKHLKSNMDRFIVLYIRCIIVYVII